MNPKLSILIPTLPNRATFLERLLSNLYTQRSYFGTESVQILMHDSETDTIGAKRNHLLHHAEGDYVAFIDDDDRVSSNYLKLLWPGIEAGADCCSLTGIITEDGNNPLVFQHSIKYQEYKTNPEGMPVRYERYPNHLNCIKASIAKQFRFPEINHGEDTDFATQIFKAGVLKTEHWIEEPIYFYDYRSNK